MRHLKSIVKQLGRHLGVEITRYRPSVPRTVGLCTDLFPHWVARLKRGGPIETVFDVGANRGQTVSNFRQVLPESMIYAFEPGAGAFAKLQKQSAGDPLVKPFRMALGDTDGSATLHENAADVTNSLLRNSTRITEFAPAAACLPVGTSVIDESRIDTFCAAKSIRCIDLLKIDTQGYERHVLAGAGDLLVPSTIRGIFLEMLFADYYQNQTWAGEIMETLRSRGYRLFGVAEVAFNEINGWTAADAMFIGDSTENQ
jgi:FkbM family methyltransferase